MCGCVPVSVHCTCVLCRVASARLACLPARINPHVVCPDVWFAGACVWLCVAVCWSSQAVGWRSGSEALRRTTTGPCANCDLFQRVVQLTEKERARHVPTHILQRPAIRTAGASPSDRGLHSSRTTQRSAPRCVRHSRAKSHFEAQRATAPRLPSTRTYTHPIPTTMDQLCCVHLSHCDHVESRTH